MLSAALALVCETTLADGNQALQVEPAVPVPARPAPAPVLPLDVPAGLFSTSDLFQREDAPTIGGIWTDCTEQHPDYFEPLGIYEEGIVIADPFTRPGVYDQAPPSAHPPTEGRLYPGIGCAFVDTGSTTVTVKVVWSGNHSINHPPPVSHVEATPLLYVTPDNSRFGFGVWPTEIFGLPWMFAGYIGAPVEKFEVVVGARLPQGHKPGTPREIELRAENPGEVTVWVDGEQVFFEDGVGFNAIQVDPKMINSTLHGFAVDAHYVDPPSSIPRIKGIESISIRVPGR